MMGKNEAESRKPVLWVGTSGWSYDHWRGTFYPESLSPREWLDFYAQQFPTVELNVTFYRLPFDNMIKSWRERAPRGFLFAVKGSRTVTHRKRLARVRADVERLLDKVQGLGEHLGPILWQLPPTLQRDEIRLKRFLTKLPRGVRYAVEFRHPSWYTTDVYQVLEACHTAIVGVSSRRMPANSMATADFVYLRFHGLAGGFAHDYTVEELRPWAKFAADCLREGRDVFAYFNNDARACAPRNARTFRTMVLDTWSARPLENTSDPTI